MPAMTNIVVKDDGTSSAAPTDRTFVPVTSQSDKAVWRNDDLTVPLDAQPRITAQWKQDVKSGEYLINIKLEVPTQEQQIGASAQGYQAAPKVAYKTWGSFTIGSPARATAVDRANVIRMMAALLAGADATAGTTVNPQATGAVGSQTYAVSDKLVHQALVRLRFPGI